MDSSSLPYINVFGGVLPRVADCTQSNKRISANILKPGSDVLSMWLHLIDRRMMTGGSYEFWWKASTWSQGALTSMCSKNRLQCRVQQQSHTRIVLLKTVSWPQKPMYIGSVTLVRRANLVTTVFLDDVRTPMSWYIHRYTYDILRMPCAHSN